jgi:hypothetical protein
MRGCSAGRRLHHRLSLQSDSPPTFDQHLTTHQVGKAIAISAADLLGVNPLSRLADPRAPAGAGPASRTLDDLREGLRGKLVAQQPYRCGDERRSRRAAVITDSGGADARVTNVVITDSGADARVTNVVCLPTRRLQDSRCCVSCLAVIPGRQ